MSNFQNQFKPPQTTLNNFKQLKTNSILSITFNNVKTTLTQSKNTPSTLPQNTPKHF